MTKHVEIVNRDGFVLRGYMELPEGATRIVTMFHGFTGNKTEHNGHFRNMARLLAKQGVASIRLDYHGNGESDGEFWDFEFTGALDDAKRIIEYAHNVEGIKEVYVMGYSFGGAVSGMIANDENCDGLVLISAAANMPQLARLRWDNALKLDNGNCYFSGFEMSEKFVTSIENKNMFANTSKLTKDVLVIQAKDDKSVPYINGVKYAVRYKNARLHIVKDSGHGYDSVENRDELYSKCLEFLTRK